MRSWLSPKACMPPHRVTHDDKLEILYGEFVESGWDASKPDLLGYPFNGKVQLISGSHRWAAADLAEIDIPVNLMTYEHVQSIWGTDAWVTMLQNPEAK